MSFGIVTEWLARIEHKLDALLRWNGVPMPAPMHFVGSLCPACGALIDYQVDFTNGVVVRRCDCKTGKVPSTIPLLPVETPSRRMKHADRDTAGDEVPEPGPQRRPR